MKPTNIYTFIMDYLGGTYISQHSANCKEDAMKLWIANLAVDEIKGFTHDDKSEIERIGFEDDDPCPLKGLTNVWHFIVNTKNETAYINVVLTCNKAEGNES